MMLNLSPMDSMKTKIAIINITPTKNKIDEVLRKVPTDDGGFVSDASEVP